MLFEMSLKFSKSCSVLTGVAFEFNRLRDVSECVNATGLALFDFVINVCVEGHPY